MPNFECATCGSRYAVDRFLVGQAIRCRKCNEFGKVLAPKERPAPRTHQKESPPIRFTCGNCSQNYEVPGEAAGKKTKCPGCGEKLTVPVPQQTPVEDLLRPEAEGDGKHHAVGRGQTPSAPSSPERVKPTRKPNNADAYVVLSVAAFACVVMVAFWVLSKMQDRPAHPPVDVRYTPPAYQSPPPAAVSKLTKENFLAVREGMGESEVTLILGQPTKRKAWPDLPEGSVRLTWKEGSKSVDIYLRRKDERSGSKVDGKWQEGLE